MQKVRLLHQMLQDPAVTDEAIETLKNSIPSDLRARVDRILQSFKLEDIFRCLYSAMPWVALIIHMNAKEQYLPVLIDVKTVLGEKETLKNIQVGQSELLQTYAKAIQAPQLFAVYWQKIQTWTINSLDHFDRKTSQYKLPLASAFVNDLSAIFGDKVYIFPADYRRRSQIDPSLRGNDEYIQHERYGGIIEESISFDGSQYSVLNPLDSAVIDSTTTMREILHEERGGIHYITEEATHPIALKLSTLILRLLAKFGQNPTPENALLVSKSIQDFFIRVKALRSIQFPRDRSPTADKLYFRTFHSGRTYQQYLAYHEVGLLNRLRLRLRGGDFV